MTEHPYTTATLAAKLGYESAKSVRKHAAKLGLGIDLGGRAGYRYSEADYQRLVEHLRPAEPTKPRRKRRAA